MTRYWPSHKTGLSPYACTGHRGTPDDDRTSPHSHPIDPRSAAVVRRWDENAQENDDYLSAPFQRRSALQSRRTQPALARSARARARARTRTHAAVSLRAVSSGEDDVVQVAGELICIVALQTTDVRDSLRAAAAAAAAAAAVDTDAAATVATCAESTETQ
jgi:hypothetical protein